MPTLVPGSRIGAFPYEIVKAMDDGLGGMSEVYLAKVAARDQGESNQVILKLAIGRQPDQQAFFQATLENEVEALRHLKHPGIVRIYPIQRDDLPNLPYIAEASALVGKPFFSIMEFLAGGSLAALIDAKRTDIGMMLEIARALAATLDYLHSRDQVHLDLKPDNVLFAVSPLTGDTPKPVLIDFGIARKIGQRGLVARTLHYAAPERVEEVPAGHATGESRALPHPAMDIYALGVVLYQMLTGRLPFDSNNPKKLSEAILHSTATPPSRYNPQINQELDTLNLQMLAKEPSQRPSAVEVAIRLEQIAIKGRYRPPARGNGQATPQLATLPKNKGGHGLLVAFLVLAFVVVVLLALFILGTYPYWQDQIAPDATGIDTLFENLRQFIQ